jgi:cyclophilin family peptidyl-prolyl cis-trans isomerase
MFKAEPRLNGGYTVFGQVEQGLDTVKALEAVGSDQDGPPTSPLNIVKVTIEVK